MMEDLKSQSGEEEASQRQLAARSNYPWEVSISRNQHNQSGTSTTGILQKKGPLGEEASIGNGASGDTVSARNVPERQREKFLDLIRNTGFLLPPTLQSSARTPGWPKLPRS